MVNQVERLNRLVAERDAARADAERLAEALEFYADPDTYFGVAILVDRPCGGFADDFGPDDDPGYGRPMPGATARAALAAREAR